MSRPARTGGGPDTEARAGPAYAGLTGSEAAGEPRASRRHRPTCLNCGTTLQGRFCHRCGQEDRDPDPRLRELLSALLDAALNWDSRLLYTLRHLVLRPGRATAEYNRGLRARYVSPVRLYVVVSVFFLTAATVAGGAVIGNVPLEVGGAGRSVEAQATWSWLVRGFGWSMFLLVPAFAVLLQLLYLRSGRRYVHHLVFAVHYHAFAFLVLTPLIALAHLSPGAWLVYLAAAVFLWIGIWPVLAMRRVYGQGWLVSTSKAGALLWLYFTIVVPLGTIPMALVLAVALGGGPG